jgi:eukaryotic-like serine/threonine-protein kinase
MSKLQIDPESWTALNRLLDQALDLDQADRAAWIAALGPKIESLKPQHRELLLRAASVETGDFLNTLPKLSASASDEERNARSVVAGETIGLYRLLRELGSGGMGLVWLAERIDGLINRPVALKLPHLIAARRADLAERMAREREILATLDHRNIAQLLDAGITADGQPFLALEFIEGVAIDQYCASNALSIAERLKLFRQVTDAVAYAHGKLIVHRDLKPANILVTANGGVKLLDFGIAKLLDQGQAKETRLTEISGRALTPDYASPEQILGEPLTVASDVYSLGVILYELLAGARPYKLKRDSRGAIEDAILQTEPTHPSALAPAADRKALRGDLDTIVLKALKKKPQQRYTTVNALADDVERYLNKRPVLAQPDSVGYRFGKFVVRNKFIVAGVATIIAALLAGTSVALWQAHIARAEQRRAESVRDLIAGIFENAQSNAEDGKPLAAVELLRQAALTTENSPSPDPMVRADITRILATALMRVSDTDSAERLAKKAREAALRDYRPDHREVIRARLLMTEVYRYRGALDEMRRELDSILTTIELQPQQYPFEHFEASHNYVVLELDTAHYEDALHWAERSRQLALSSFGVQSRQYARAMVAVAGAYLYLERPDESLTVAREAVQRTLEVNDGNKLHPSVLSSRVLLARSLDQAGQLPAAIQELESVVHDATLVLGPDSRSVGFYLQNLVVMRIRSGRIKGAIDAANRSLEISKSYMPLDSTQHVSRQHALGNALLAARRGPEAARLYDVVNTVTPKLFGPYHRHTLELRASGALARAYTGDTKGAAHAAQQILADLEHVPAVRGGRVLFLCGRIARLNGDFTRAITLIERSLGTESTFREESERANAHIELAMAQLALKAPGAENLLMDSLKTLDAAGQTATPTRSDALMALSFIRARQHREAEAQELAKEAVKFWQEFDSSNPAAQESLHWLQSLTQ